MHLQRNWQVSHKTFWNGTAHSRVAEVNSLTLDNLPGRFLLLNDLATEGYGYKAMTTRLR